MDFSQTVRGQDQLRFLDMAIACQNILRLEADMNIYNKTLLLTKLGKGGTA